MIKKLRLDLEALSVESFATADGEGGRGTVRGNVAFGEANPNTDESTCNPEQACGCIPTWQLTTDSCQAAVAGQAAA
jgi:hypothetical protein